jgi:flavin-dependent dehydrogenase
MAKREQVDVLVIGAGPSGSVSSAFLHRNGFKVKVVEKERFPRFVIGESLLPRCMDNFEEVGLLDVLKKQNYQIKVGARFVRDGKDCWFDFEDHFSKGWTWTWQVPRGHFDKVLIDEVASWGVDVAFETAVTAVDTSGERQLTTVRHADGGETLIESKFVIDASGYGRVLPRLLQLDQPSVMPPRSSIFSHFTDRRRPEGILGERITLVIHRKDVWLWIIPFSNGITSVGFAGNPDYFATYDNDDKSKQLLDMINDVPFVRERFHDQEMVVPGMMLKTYSASVKSFFGPGYVLAGNSSEFIDPVFSSGVTFATESGVLAAKLAKRQLNGEGVDWQAEYVMYMHQGIDFGHTPSTATPGHRQKKGRIC